jgi:uncharacterized protein with von Willebrand factor type A (vWA) domain
VRHALGRFCDRLRREGVRVSAAELIDAARAVSTVDVADRELLRDVLAVTLVKSRDDLEVFSRAFDAFFVAPPFRGTPTKRRRRRRARGTPDGTGAGGRPGVAGEPTDATSIIRGARRRMLATVDRPRRGERPGAARYPVPIVRPAHRRDESREDDRRLSLERALDEREREGRRRRGHRRPERPAPEATRPGEAAAGDLRPTLARTARKPFRERWTPGEERALAELLERALRRMRLVRTRRRVRARRGPIWVQRVVRTNLGHDGVPFSLIHRTRSRREPRIVLLVDVSHSVARAASAFLTLATHLATTLRAVRCHLFVDNVVDATAHLPRLSALAGDLDALDEVVEGAGALNASALSDYGRVLYQLLDEHRHDLRHDTVLVVLGDARTNRFDPAAWVLEEIRARVRRIVWLVPEPLAEWDTGDSVVRAYAPHVDLLAEAADLEGLRTAIDHALPRR